MQKSSQQAKPEAKNQERLRSNSAISQDSSKKKAKGHQNPEAPRKESSVSNKSNGASSSSGLVLFEPARPQIQDRERLEKELLQDEEAVHVPNESKMAEKLLKKRRRLSREEEEELDD